MYFTLQINPTMKSMLTAIFMLVVVQAASAQKVRISDPTNKCVIAKYIPHPCYCTQLNNWSYNTTVQIGPYTYSKLKDSDFYIREDTTANMVYSKYGNHPEVLLYDYNWKIGDTVVDQTYVREIDTIEVNGFNHKVFHLYDGNVWGTIIEGFGNIDFPFSLMIGSVAISSHIICFSNAAGTPIIIDTRPTQYHCFNLTACKTVGVASIESKTKELTIYPQPAQKEFTIQLPETLNGQLAITNSIGQIVHVHNIENEQTIRVNNLALNAGIYYYRISCNTCTANYSGKILFE